MERLEAVRGFFDGAVWARVTTIYSDAALCLFRYTTHSDASGFLGRGLLGATRPCLRLAHPPRSPWQYQSVGFIEKMKYTYLSIQPGTAT